MKMKRCQFCKAFTAWNYCPWCGRGEMVRDSVIIIGLLLSILIALGLYYPYIRLMMFLLWGV